MFELLKGINIREELFGTSSQISDVLKDFIKIVQSPNFVSSTHLYDAFTGYMAVVLQTHDISKVRSPINASHFFLNLIGVIGKWQFRNTTSIAESIDQN